MLSSGFSCNAQRYTRLHDYHRAVPKPGLLGPMLLELAAQALRKTQNARLSPKQLIV